MPSDTIIAHPAMKGVARDIAGTRGMMLRIQEDCPRGMLFEVDSNAVWLTDASGRSWQPYAVGLSVPESQSQ